MLFDEHVIDVPWGKMAVSTGGQKTDSPVILMHGISDSGGTFVPLVQRLPPGFYFIMPDLPGCGQSDPFPPGHHLQVLDYVYPIKLVVDHFKLEKFTFIGHSMGAQLGHSFNAVYPGMITRFVALDFLSYAPVESNYFGLWFKNTYEKFYDAKNYKIFQSDIQNAPKYTYQEALDIVMKRRKLSEDGGLAVLKRCLVYCGDGLYRFTWDQRMKVMSIPPFSSKYQIEVYGKMNVPHLTIFAHDSIKQRLGPVGVHMLKAHTENNPHYRLAMLPGNHDVHLNSPQLVAPLVGDFILGSTKNFTIEDREMVVKTLNKYYTDLCEEKPLSKL